MVGNTVIVLMLNGRSVNVSFSSLPFFPIQLSHTTVVPMGLISTFHRDHLASAGSCMLLIDNEQLGESKRQE